MKGQEPFGFRISRGFDSYKQLYTKLHIPSTTLALALASISSPLKTQIKPQLFRQESGVLEAPL